MKLVFVITALALSGCGQTARMMNDLAGDVTPYCFKGVTYVALGRDAIVVARDKADKPIECQ
jgi:hypothetical protein